jgi:hypothetical protein
MELMKSGVNFSPTSFSKNFTTFFGILGSNNELFALFWNNLMKKD